MIELKIKGGRELNQLLQQLPVEIETKILRGALVRGVNVLRDEARALVPAKSGKLRRAIKTSRKTSKGQVIAKVKLLGEHSFLGLFMEYGVAPHLISAGDADVSTRALNKRAKKSGVLKQMDNGLIRVGGYSYTTGPKGQRTGDDAGTLKIKDAFVGGAVWHPGFAAKPFLRPAFDTKADDAVAAIGKFIGDYVQFGAINAPTIAVDEEE